jgi:hypothetical protein
MQIMELESARAEAQAEARSLAAELDSLRSEGGSPSPSPTVRPPFFCLISERCWWMTVEQAERLMELYSREGYTGIAG